MYQPKNFSEIAEPFSELSHREQQVVTLVCDGLSNKEIAELPRHNAPDLVAAIRYGVMEQLKRERNGDPGPFTYRCPRTGQAVQGRTVDDPNRSGENYEPVTCTACGLTHLVNPKSGTALEST